MVKETNKFKVSIENSTYFLVEIKQGVAFEATDLNQLVEFQNQLLGKKLPVLIICSPDTIADTDFLNYMAKNENSPFSVADSFVITSLAQKILANVYTKIIKPERPVKFFNNKDEGLKWLEQFMR